MPEPLCAICQKPASEHHTFTTIQPQVLPPGCKCNPKDWKPAPFKIPPPCGAYTEDDTMPGHCIMCEHLEECHNGHSAPAMAAAA